MEYNDIGISRQLDFPRIKKLLVIGVFASILHLIGDFILGWGVEDESLQGIARMLSAYTSTSDGGIFAAAILGMVGMTLEGLCYFGVYRLMAEQSAKCAHVYRSGIFGYIVFGACGFHVPMCAAAFLLKHDVATELVGKYLVYFAVPAIALFAVSLAVVAITQIVAFAKGYTPYPKWACVLSLFTGMLVALIVGSFGNHPFINAVYCAWIAIGNLFMFASLLVAMPKQAKVTQQ